MTNRFFGKSRFNKLLLLIGVPLKSIQVKEWNKKNVINRNIEYGGHKSGENPNLGLPRVHILYNCLEYLEA